MQILIQTQNGNVVSANINESQTVLDLKKQIQKMMKVNLHDIVLIYGNNILKDYSTIKSYSIHSNSLIAAFKKTNGGIIPCIKPSPPIGDVYNRVYPSLLPKGKLSNRFFNITNATHAYFQRNSDCYAYAATSAFINTALRIYGLKDYVPSFGACYKEACYEKEKGGNVSKAINLIEKKYPRGIRCEERDNITIQDVLTLSVVVSFSTSQIGWNNVANGDLLTFPIGEADGFHAALVEGYDLDLDCFICKNSWGGLSSQPRFNFCPSATHWHKFTIVYFTEESIKGKTDKQYKPRMEKFNGKLKNQKIHCAWMDLTTAIHDMNYVCEFHPERKGDLKFLGYKIDEWININLNRKKGQNYPDTYIYNTLKKNEYRYLLEILQSNDLLERIEKEVPEPKSLIEIKHHQIFNIPIPFPSHEVPKLKLRPFLGGKLTKRFIRNSNMPTPYIYHQTPIYAYVAAYSYIDTLYRIYGVENIPTFGECLKIACYSGTQKGSALKAIELLEDHFNFGIKCCITDDITPRDAMTLSVIAEITTCNEGWENIKKGEFFEYVEGDKEKTGYSLVKGYDFRSRCFICKNLNDEFDEKPFFNYKCRAAMKSRFIVVYFTLDDINIIKEYKPKMRKFIGLLRLKQINCAWMDEKTAQFETNYVIEYHPEKKGKLKYLGYEIDEWIEIMSTRCYLLHHPNCLLI